ncbi:hypothetical protein LrDSM24759_12490 [Lactobacillus rodentium]|uniref:Uncharacterized protein n=1 Tax=Lactobacillus rodentium TaxID=947835 RepID=A0A2Z6TE69_9LACO|nr:hypothetical protein LrDSM24759_12490 [Lactobacillus rodentium]
MKKLKFFSLCFISIFGLQLWRDMTGIGASKLIYLPPTIHTTHIDHHPYNYNDKN